MVRSDSRGCVLARQLETEAKNGLAAGGYSRLAGQLGREKSPKIDIVAFSAIPRFTIERRPSHDRMMLGESGTFGALMSESAYQPAGYCPKCGYRVDPGRCSECGREVKRPWRIRPRVWRRWRWLMVGALLIGLGVFVWQYGAGLAARYAPSAVLVWVWEGDRGGADWAAAVLRSRVSASYTANGRDGQHIELEFRNKIRPMERHDWAGDYGQPMWWLLGCRGLQLSESEVLWLCSSMIESPALMRGWVHSFDGQRLRLELPADRAALRWHRRERNRQWLDCELVLIRWGDWRYLVAPEELLDFCNDVNAGEPLPEYHLTRKPSNARSMSHRPADGTPELPPPYDQMILGQPISVTIQPIRDLPLPHRGPIARLVEEARLASLTAHAYEIEIRADRYSDTFVGMRLYAPDRLGMAHIVSIKGDAVRARYVELAHFGSHRALVRGYGLTTRAPAPVSLDKRQDDSRRGLSAMLGYSWPKSGSDANDGAALRSPVTEIDWILLELARELRE